jgi:hypothetical protein
MLFSAAGALLFTSLAARASPVPGPQTGCTAYTLIDTRGTTEPQGPSVGFLTMNNNIQAQVPGGSVYSTVYPADWSQNSTAATLDILDRLDSTLAEDPAHCFILEGYSQGASATTNALNLLSSSDPRFGAVKGVFLIGNPMHFAGLECNFDTTGGKSTKDVDGLSVALGRIPDEWVGKTLDVCNFVSRPSLPSKAIADEQGDGVCDTTHGDGINAEHLVYPNDTSTQTLGTNFVVARLQGTA